MTECRPRGLTARDLWDIPRVGLPAIRTGSMRVVYTTTVFPPRSEEGVAPRRSQVHLIDLEASTHRTLTDPESNASAASISPDGRQLAFVRAAPDEERGQLHLLPLDGGEARRLTDLPLGVEDPRWLPNGRGIIFLSQVLVEATGVEETRKLIAERGGAGPRPHVTEDRLYRFWDRWLTTGEVHHLFRLDLPSGTLTDLTPQSRRWFPFMETSGQFDISPDGSEVAFCANSSEPPHERIRWAIFTVSTTGGEVRCRTPQNPAGDHRPRYSRDGSAIYFGTQREWDFYADRVRLARLDRSSGAIDLLTDGWDRSLEDWLVPVEGDDLLALTAERGRTALYRVPLDGAAPTRIVSGGTLAGLSQAGDGSVIVQHASLTQAPEIARIPAAGGDIELLTRHAAERIGERALGRVEELEVRGAGGEPVHTWLVHPPGGRAEEPLPLVHFIHGGPHGTFGDGFHFRWNPQVIAAQGARVALVNFHGSTSYGQGFAASIHGGWGDMPCRDVEAVTDHLVTRGDVDPDMLAVAGGSYGGYLAAWITTQTDRYRCAVCHAGVCDFDGMYGGDITQGRARALGGEPWQERQAVERWDPVVHSAGMRTPMLVIHGERDYRVPVTQGLQLYGILKARGVEARLVYYPDENHWILRRENSLHWYGEVISWLDRFLGLPGLADEEPASLSSLEP